MCNRCGSANPASVLSCQVCGTPLASKVESELNSRVAAPQNQPPLPAWLETLRAGEHPGAQANTASNPGFSAADLLDEGTLPSWMQSGRTGPQGAASSISQDAFSMNGYGQSTPQEGLRPSSQLSPNTGEGDYSARGITANSLIDERSLPSWMQENKQPQQEPQSSISAASLLQPDALPEWMRTIQPQATAQNQQGRSDSQSFASFSSAASSFSVSPSGKFETPAPGQMPQGFAAGDLVDPQALPSWMVQAGGNQSIAPRTPGASPEQGGVAASSLLDSDALPPWLRQGGQEPQRNMTNPSASTSSPRSLAGQNLWPPAPSHIQPSAQMPTGSIAASSFIDMNSLPGWMRPDSGVGQQQSGPSGPARPGVVGHGRVENMRVPNRPRNEMSLTGNTSEAAANAFASMLGVASVAPQYPGQPVGTSPTQGGQYTPPQGGQYSSPPQKPPVAPSPSVPPIGTNSGIYSQSPVTPPGTGPGAYGAQMGYQSGGYQSSSGYQGNIPPGYSAMPQGTGQGTGSFSNPPAANYGMGGASGYNSGMAGPGFAGASEDQRANKPAKRGFFDAIRDLFFRSN